MSWFGKAIGGSIGFALGGPLGAVTGAVFGHAFDLEDENKVGRQQSRLAGLESNQMTFFVSVFSMIAKVVKADGRISRKEVEAVESIVSKDLNLESEGREIALKIFRSALFPGDSFDTHARRFYARFSSQQRLLELVIDLLLRVAVADDDLNKEEERMILAAVHIFQIGTDRYAKLKSKYVRDIDKYYSLLKCKPSDSSEQIKSRYRKMVLGYHPDRIINLGLPEEFTQLANDKFREIQEAYDAIKKERKIA